MILKLISLTLVIALTGYWLLTIVAPLPAGWSDNEVWIPVDRIGLAEGVESNVGVQDQSLQDEDRTSMNEATADQSERIGHGTYGVIRDQSDSVMQGEDAPPSLDDPEETSLISLNRADARQLELLPGIGPSKAQAILDYRQTNGAFESLDELLQVKGIGEKTMANIRPYLKLD